MYVMYIVHIFVLHVHDVHVLQTTFFSPDLVIGAFESRALVVLRYVHVHMYALSVLVHPYTEMSMYIVCTFTYYKYM